MDNRFETLFENIKEKGEATSFNGLKPCFKECLNIRNILSGSDIRSIVNFINEKRITILTGNISSSEKSKLYEDLIRFILFFRKRGIVSGGLRFILAKLCFERALLILPKAFGTPGKKIRLLYRALDELEKALTSQTELRDDCLKMKALVCIELARSGESVPFYNDILREAADLCDNTDDLDEIEIVLTSCESNPEGINSQRFFLEELLKKRKANGADLLVARAAFLLNTCSKENILEEVIETEALSRPLSSPWWENLIYLLKKLPSKDKLKIGWQAFEKIRYIEGDFRLHNLHLIWYWSRIKELYELVVLAAIEQEEYFKALYIIDSLKGRPALRWTHMEKTELKNFLERERLGRLGYYVKNLGTVNLDRRFKVKEIPSDLEAYFVDRLPEDTIAVHFFIYQDGSRGLALLLDKRGDCRIENFRTESLWKAYLKFQNSYQLSSDSENRETVSMLMNQEKEEGVLYELGDQFGFLFDIAGQVDAILFVPHGFLHRLPIHGALKRGELLEPLIRKVKCFYFPAWGWLDMIEESFQRSTEGTEGVVVLKRFEEYRYDDIKDIVGEGNWFEKSEEYSWDMIRDHECYVFLCHGEADPIDPFQSRLKLSPPLSVKDILIGESPNVWGSVIFIGACEADLMPPINEAIDEHISPSSAFLIRGAEAVVGTLWEAKCNHIEELFAKLLKERTTYDILGSLKDWQGSSFEYESEEDFFEYLPFRMYLRPELLKRTRR